MPDLVYAGVRAPPTGFRDDGHLLDRYAKWRAKLGRDLLNALEEGNTAIVKVCLQQEADCTAVDLPTGRGALHAAAASGNVEVMQEILNCCMRSKADLAMRDAEQRTPLDEALEVPRRRHMLPEVMVPLLAAGKEAPEVGKELQLSDSKWRQTFTSLLDCCTRPVPMAHEAALEVVLQSWCYTGVRGGPPSKVQELRRGLFACVAKNNPGGVEALALARADLNRLDPRSCRTALELSEALMHHPVTDVLKLHKTSSRRNPHFEQWALCLAAARGDVQGLMQWIDHGDVDWRDPPPSERGTALMYAAAGGHADVAMALVEAQACPAFMDAKNRRPCDLALEVGAKALAQHLERLAEAWLREHPGADVKAEPWQKPSDWLEAAPEVDEGGRPLGMRAAVRANALKGNKGKRKLIVEVIRAERLASSIFHFNLDPFVKVRIGQEVQQSALSEGASPVWNEKFEFWVQGTEVLIFSVWDWDDGGTEEHDFMARAELPLKHHVKELYKGRKVELELELGNQISEDPGSIFVNLQLAESKNAQSGDSREPQRALKSEISYCEEAFRLKTNC